ncbi:MAG: methionyl-tRNA formyltransferase [Flavobacteriales bacterium]|nr:methionyl-tRNA formyltransferase [Flavobacteriales bacterium]
MSSSIRIVFMGTPGFAVESLKKLHTSHHQVVGTVTAPDRPAGRGQKTRPSEVKKFAESVGIPILQPMKLKSPEFLEQLEELRADLFVVVAFRMLPEAVWSMPPLGTINLHASLLPQYRGAAPINWAIIHGERITGATTFFINAEIDKGEIIDQVEVPIGDEDDAGDLHDRLMYHGSELLVRTVNDIAAGKAVSKAQDTVEGDWKKAPKLNSENRRIDWSQSARDVYNLIRGLSPYPSAYTELVLGEEESMNCKIFRTRICDTAGELAPGHITTDNKTYLRVGTGTNELEIEQIQMAGKRRMGIKDVLNGFDFPHEARFE